MHKTYQELDDPQLFHAEEYYAAFSVYPSRKPRRLPFTMRTTQEAFLHMCVWPHIVAPDNIPNNLLTAGVAPRHTQEKRAIRSREGHKTDPK